MASTPRASTRSSAIRAICEKLVSTLIPLGEGTPRTCRLPNTPTYTQIQEIRGMLENLCLADLGYTPASLDYAMTHDRAAWRKNVPDLPVHVIPIMETAFFDVVAFVMPPGSRFEMHDHMGMVVLSKLITGRLRMSAVTLVPTSFASAAAAKLGTRGCFETSSEEKSIIFPRGTTAQLFQPGDRQPQTNARAPMHKTHTATDLRVSGQNFSCQPSSLPASQSASLRPEHGEQLSAIGSEERVNTELERCFGWLSRTETQNLVMWADCQGTDDNDAPEEAQPRTVANLKFAEEQEGDGWIARVMFDGRLHSSLPHPPKTLALLSSISEEACDLLPCSRFPTSWAALPCLFNGHMIEAETTCVLFDVLSPPYLLHSGRPCRFFSLLGRPDERGCDEPTVPRHPEADIGSGDADAADASDASGNEVWWHVSFPPELVTIPYMSQLSFGAHSPSEIACEAE
eukprot:GHVT01048706.1.p1 GENE.GHVT01048706.1~~GHVT01048706.1.p1  ORF type:complete len:457 (+),score=57.06 GHVT01048706.1:931-2301(+)